MMNPVDRAWLEMDEPGNPMVISALFQLDGPVDAALFQKTLVERLLRYSRFRQRIDGTNGQPCWKTDADLDFSYHVQVRRLPEGHFERHLARAISAEISRDLDHARPLWRLLLFPQAGGPVTVLFRAHHALADGVALVTLLIDSTDAGMERVHVPPAQRPGRSPRGGPLGRLIDELDLLNRGLDYVGKLAAELKQPKRFVLRLHQGRATFGAIRHVLSLPKDKPAALGNALSGRRNVAWIDGVPFAPVRQLAHRLDVRVNDIFMSTLAGAFGRQLRCSLPDLPEQQNLRVSIPVNLRNGRGRDLGNQFGLVLLDLPVGMRDPLQRLRTVSQRMEALKASLEAKVTLLSLAAAGHLPIPLEKKLVNLIGTKSVAVVSNLPGPKRHVRIGGARMRNLVFWPPQAGGIGIGVSFFTYAGALSIGISADRNVLPNPQRVLDVMREELELLRGREHSTHGHALPEFEPAAGVHGQSMDKAAG
jgi:WS/DGAT/MGAT family acyltransferase